MIQAQWKVRFGINWHQWLGGWWTQNCTKTIKMCTKILHTPSIWGRHDSLSFAPRYSKGLSFEHLLITLLPIRSLVIQDTRVPLQMLVTALPSHATIAAHQNRLILQPSPGTATHTKVGTQCLMQAIRDLLRRPHSWIHPRNPLQRFFVSSPLPATGNPHTVDPNFP